MKDDDNPSNRKAHRYGGCEDRCHQGADRISLAKRRNGGPLIDTVTGVGGPDEIVSTVPPVFATITPKDALHRIAALQAMAVLDTPPEDGFNALARLAAIVCETPIALVSLIDGDRLWFKAMHGLGIREIDSKNSFCCEAANSKKLFEVTSARRDPRFASNGLVTGELGIQFYAGVPIMHNAVAVGTVCVLDRTPRVLSSNALLALHEMATLATVMLRARIEAYALFSGAQPLERA
jgi:GAF domain-containing protein